MRHDSRGADDGVTPEDRLELVRRRVHLGHARTRLPIVSASQVARLVAKVLPTRLNSAAVLWEKLRHEPQ
eukprot:14148870-Alexandrium_andersonii.AAC.1